MVFIKPFKLLGNINDEFAKRILRNNLKDESVEIVEKLTDVLRADVKLVFNAKHRKTTAHNTFYNYEAMNLKGVVYKNNAFTFNGIKYIFNKQEVWGATREGDGSGVLISFDIKDKLGNVLEKKIHNYDDKLRAFKVLIKYLTLLNRVGTHQGALEIYALWKEVNILNRKLKKLE